MVSTYHAYAARLVADHALREALEPTLRLITPAVAWQIAARVVSGYGGPMDAVTWSPPAVTAAVLMLAGELAEHLRTPDEVTRVGDWLEAQAAALPGRLPARCARSWTASGPGSSCCPMVAGYARAKAEREVIDHGDQVAIAARIAARHPEVGAAERGRYQVVLLDEYQDTSHAQLVLLRALFGGGHPVTAVGDPVPVHLRLARRERGQPAPVRPGLPGGHGQRPWPDHKPGRGAHAVHQLPEHRPGPGRRRGGAAGVAGGGARGPPAGPAAGPGRPRAGDLRAHRDGRRRGGLGRRAGQRAAGAAARGGPRRRAVAGRPRGQGPSRATSRSCAASGPSSRRCGRRSKPAASRSRWSAWAGCSPCRRWLTSSPRCGCCTTPARPRRWPGCSPARAGGSARATWWRWASGPGPWPASSGRSADAAGDGHGADRPADRASGPDSGRAGRATRWPRPSPT